MVGTEIRLIIFFAAKDGEALYSQQKQDWELTEAQIMNTLLPSRDGSPSDFPAPGILQARTLEWVAISFSMYTLYFLSCIPLCKHVCLCALIFALENKVSYCLPSLKTVECWCCIRAPLTSSPGSSAQELVLSVSGLTMKRSGNVASCLSEGLQSTS